MASKISDFFDPKVIQRLDKILLQLEKVEGVAKRIDKLKVDFRGAAKISEDLDKLSTSTDRQADKQKLLDDAMKRTDKFNASYIKSMQALEKQKQKAVKTAEAQAKKEETAAKRVSSAAAKSATKQKAALDKVEKAQKEHRAALELVVKTEADATRQNKALRIERGKVGKYARGGANIAIESGAPIVPIALNAGLYWPSDKFLKYPGTITVVIGKPIECADKNSRELTSEAQEWIEGEMEKLT